MDRPSSSARVHERGSTSGVWNDPCEAHYGNVIETAGRKAVKGYLIANVTITDPARYEKYRQRTPAVAASFGGHFLVRGGAVETVEGDHMQSRIIVLEFDTIERARAFYDSPAYQEIAQIRTQAARSHIILVEGYDDPAAAHDPSRTQ
jgi:uncharacterized protein (DUF1330 family)